MHAREFVELETGKGSDALERRPQLRQTLASAKKPKCAVVVAKLDRLARGRGVLDNPNLAAIRGSGDEGKAEAERFAANVLPIIAQTRKAGASTLQQIADDLNDRGVTTARGCSWHPSNVRHVLVLRGEGER